MQKRPRQLPGKKFLSRVGDKWPMLRVVMRSDHGTIPFKELSQLIDAISPILLTETLKMLEADALLERKMDPQIPPKMEYYTLTALSESLVPPLMTLYNWDNAPKPAIKAARERSESHLRDQESADPKFRSTGEP
ncbi:winged helix-turn-helix transcriptional regulator [Mucilaginibacter pedocola]|uniref:winged helix-turn-helix transcriptional regulator n=1 Tax=Mucilaginibacter pedocola TaxID=1792845 RepID=UPI00117FB6CF|nr:helix-turn-helix domain-containing protein [Mucilaginibacter pedocola]